MIDLAFDLLVAGIAFAAGAVASVSGFGIGSFLTPLLALEAPTKVAVAAVAIPHLLGSAMRCWRMRRDIDRRVLLSFGAMSAMGGLAGSLLHAVVQSPLLRTLFGALLLVAGLWGLTGFLDRLRLRGTAAWAAGFLSGVLGGLVGTQGGIRAAALFGFEIRKEAFVATATAVALVVDGVRTPIYLATQGPALAALWVPILIASLGVAGGTLVGERVLRRIAETVFRRVVSVLLLLLGASMIFLSKA